MDAIDGVEVRAFADAAAWVLAGRQPRAAPEDGGWAAAYESQRRATVPPDVVAARADDTTARAALEALG